MRVPDAERIDYFGIYAFDHVVEVPPYLDGYRTAVFKTRLAARTALANLGRRAPDYWKNAKVVRVAIRITEAPWRGRA